MKLFLFLVFVALATAQINQCPSPDRLVTDNNITVFNDEYVSPGLFSGSVQTFKTFNFESSNQTDYTPLEIGVVFDKNFIISFNNTKIVPDEDSLSLVFAQDLPKEGLYTSHFKSVVWYMNWGGQYPLNTFDPSMKHLGFAFHFFDELQLRDFIPEGRCDYVDYTTDEPVCWNVSTFRGQAAEDSKFRYCSAITVPDNYTEGLNYQGPYYVPCSVAKLGLLPLEDGLEIDNYTSTDFVMPYMGTHLIELNSTSPDGMSNILYEDEGYTLAYGKFDGKLVFVQPTLTLNYLLDLGNDGDKEECYMIPQPNKYLLTGYTPRMWCIRYKQSNNLYTLSLEDFSYEMRS